MACSTAVAAVVSALAPANIRSGFAASLDFAAERYMARGRTYSLSQFPGWSFSRASSAWNAVNGQLVEFPADVPRVIPGAGLALQAPTIRLSRHPQTRVNWSEGVVDVAPLDTTTEGFERRRYISRGEVWNRASGPMSHSLQPGDQIWVRARYEAGSSGRCLVRFRNSNNGSSADVNGPVGALDANQQAAGSISNLRNYDLGGGVYEVVFQVTISTATDTNSIDIGPDSDVAGEYVIAHGAQVTNAPSAWILGEPSEQAAQAADRGALTDVDALGLTAAVLAAGYTLYVETQEEALLSGARYLLIGTTGSNDGSALLRHGAADPAAALLEQRDDAGVHQGVAASNGLVVGQVNKIAIRVEANNSGVSVNGETVGVDTSVSPASLLDTVFIGPFGGPVANMIIKRIDFSDRLYSDAELQALTTGGA